MAHLVIRRALRNLGMLDTARAIKKKFYYRENAFKPADPRLLISMNACLAWLHERNLLEGRDYQEYGIFRGFTLWYVQAQLKNWHVHDVEYFGYDSFFGLPEVEGIDAGGAFAEGDFYASKEEVEIFYNRFGIDWLKTKLVPGFFSKSLTEENKKEHKGRPFSLCVVDCDLYSSAVEVLEYIESMVADQSIVWFDDWGDYGNDPEKGERLAFKEFLERNPHISAEPFPVEGGSGTGFILRLGS